MSGTACCIGVTLVIIHLFSYIPLEHYPADTCCIALYFTLVILSRLFFIVAIPGDAIQRALSLTPPLSRREREFTAFPHPARGGQAHPSPRQRRASRGERVFVILNAFALK